jgi:hypothetical protein
MRKPLTKPKVFGRAATIDFLAPVKGLRSDQGQMQEQPESAMKCINWVPETDALRARRGFSEHAFDLNDGTAVETLMVYNSGTASELFGANDEYIWEVTDAGDVGASPAVSGQTEAYNSWVNFTASSGTHYLVVVNGADNNQTYDGSSWATQSWTGATDNDLIFVWSFKTRLWFIKKNSMSAYYLGTGAISGALTAFQLGAVFKKGGKLLAGGTWSVDSAVGTGMDDMIVFVSDQGEVAVYEMSDPDDATSLLLKGVYDVGRPLGQRCLINIGGDLLILTYKGLIPLSKAVAVKKEKLDAEAITSPIRQAFSDDAVTYGSLEGWDLQSYPQANLVIINVPIVEHSQYKQYVFNVLTGAFAEWKAINSVCWGLFGDNIYFGGTDDVVYKADTGSSDDGAAITAEVLTHYSSLGQKGRIKQVTLVKPIVRTNSNVGFGLNVLGNYALPDSPPNTSEGGVDRDGFTWDESNWDEDSWAGSVIVDDWFGGNGSGDVVAIHYAVNVATSSDVDLEYRLFGFRLAYQIGGPLGG